VPRGLVLGAVAALMLPVLLVLIQIVRPLPDPAVRLVIAASHTFPGSAPQLPWPVKGQAAVEVEGLGGLGTSGAQTPTPTASVAKVMTAYVFLTDHALRDGEDGPTYTISAEEAARLPDVKARQETHVDVVAGQEFTEREALEALMIVSANNIAHEMARWDAGSDVAYVQKMNATARALGMTNTVYTDPSGYDSSTVSTAADQVKLLRAAMRIPAFARVVGMSSYTPSQGGETRAAGNTLLGHYGVIGGKTGFTDAAGGNYVFAARKRVGATTALIVGAVMAQSGATTPGPAIDAARQLIEVAEGSLTSVTLARTGERVAQVDDGLGGHTPLLAVRPVTVAGWPGLTVRLTAEGRPPHQARAGGTVGAVAVGSGPGRARTDLRLARSLTGPGLPDRLLRLG
jgi:D-alanyl-D-alanine carboxypeptidase